jgi:8-oxo-dGTP diphosphatase
VNVLLVRHAKAGDRDAWRQPDDIRPLTNAGQEQAQALVEQLAGFPITRVISSRFTRCVQTVEPLAAARGLDVETDEALAEGAHVEQTLTLIASLDQPAALCTHGDVVQWLVGHLQAKGVPGADERLGDKGSTWVLSVDGAAVTSASYLEPPT